MGYENTADQDIGDAISYRARSASVNGDSSFRLAGNLHIPIPGIPNSTVVARVRSQLAIFTASACSSGVETPSHVLQALDLVSEIIEGASRIGIGRFTTEDEIKGAALVLSDAIDRASKVTMLIGSTA